MTRVCSSAWTIVQEKDAVLPKSWSLSTIIQITMDTLIRFLLFMEKRTDEAEYDRESAHMAIGGGVLELVACSMQNCMLFAGFSRVSVH